MIETPTYEIMQLIQQDKWPKRIEIRKYPPLILVKVEQNEDEGAFGYLFRYITGNNRTQKKIPMTAPVITSEKIPMTAPVITQQKSRKQMMAFVVPKQYTPENAPIPLDPAVHLEEIPERILAVLRFSGYTPEKRVKEYQQELLNILYTKHIPIIGEPMLMRYNSPFSLGFMRQNEVAVEIKLPT
jgi:hypothetical protein